ncbi:hypothetical protein PLICBS_000958 [Purpureocillium lilacinum]|uniref:uncharacterized protein n=1 Tax=Purpureocillium lilacinum TaxID=33203 RepID=UPI0020871535|nr:hypothetical protein PLICBS_000958 [Purpureocillium lilacinum]
MECIPATYPEFGEMIINQQLVAEATMEAEASRNAYRSKRFTTQNVPLIGAQRGDTSVPEACWFVCVDTDTEA